MLGVWEMRWLGVGFWDNWGMLGTERFDRGLLDALLVCGGLIPEGSVYPFLAEHRLRVFPDELFGDLFGGRGRPSVPAFGGSDGVGVTGVGGGV